MISFQSTIAWSILNTTRIGWDHGSLHYLIGEFWVIGSNLPMSRRLKRYLHTKTRNVLIARALRKCTADSGINYWTWNCCLKYYFKEKVFHQRGVFQNFKQNKNTTRTGSCVFIQQLLLLFFSRWCCSDLQTERQVNVTFENWPTKNEK